MLVLIAQHITYNPGFSGFSQGAGRRVIIYIFTSKKYLSFFFFNQQCNSSYCHQQSALITTVLTIGHFRLAVILDDNLKALRRKKRKKNPKRIQ